jgi:hypothetical protein
MKRTRWLAFLLVGALGAMGCGGDGDASPDAGGDATGPISGGPDCDPIHTTRCAMPWPSSLYLEEDASRVTGYTLGFGETSLPPNIHGVHPNPAPYRVLDGYGVGSAVMVSFPGVDTSAMPAEQDMGVSMEASSPTVWLELDDAGNVVGRVPHWAELDLRNPGADDQVLFLRPGVILKEATRYVIAFRDVHDTSGNPFAPEEAFVRLRDGNTADEPLLAPRQARFDEVFAALESEGIDRSELTLAWDFVTASSDGLHGTMLHVRDQGIAAFDAMGLVVDTESLRVRFFQNEVQEPDPEDEDMLPYNANIAVRIQGTFEVPNFLEEHTISDFSSRRLHRDASGEVAQDGTRQAALDIIIPYSALDGEGTPHDLMIYGHGLLGSASQVGGSGVPELSNTHNIISFATDWTGMASPNQVDAIQSLNELSRFVFLSEQLHQGILDFILLSRGMRDGLQDLLDALPQTEDLGIVVTDDPDHLYYSGISQGGIFGASFMALTPDIRRGHLGVPGNNYNTLLQRSIDFTPFSLPFNVSYPSPTDQVMGLAHIGLLWEMTEPVSYLRHITAEPFAGNDPHHVLLASATADWQVALITNEIATRSDMGIELMANYGRDVWGVEETPFPHEGSGLVNYSFGNPWPPPGNITPEDDIGDPHSWPRRTPEHQQQLMHFLHTGEIIDVCGGEHCEFSPP